MKLLSDYIKENLILFLNTSSRDETIQTMVNNLWNEKEISQTDFFYQAILDREKLVSTGIGMGVAIPHAKIEHGESFFISIGILSKGVNWKAIDHAPVRIIFMIGGPDDKQTEYLQILSSITQFIKNEEIRKKLLTSNSKEAIIELFHKNR